MRAFVLKPNSDLGGFVTNHYKTLRNLITFGVKPYIKEPRKVEVFYNWENRYGEPDKIIEVKP